MSKEEIKTLFNVVDKLEKRIFLLEKCIGNLTKRYAEVRQHLEGEQDDA
jgi:prefoldin subunit 5